ncbi:TPA: hypothetical protein DEW47_02770 [Patescibacteria group bacterium]|nr:hypothetical protein [Patescibacteria group bacterium]HCI04876.1 hypothetical protein [Patescibacteria group bacterium]
MYYIHIFTNKARQVIHIDIFLILSTPLRHASQKKLKKSNTLQSASEKELRLLEKGILSSAFAGDF